MSIHLHELYEDESLEVYPRAVTPHPPVCFDIGEFGTLSDLVSSPAMSEMEVRLPFATCWFEMQSGIPAASTSHIGVLTLLADPDFDDCVAAVYLRRDGQWHFLAMAETRKNLHSATVRKIREQTDDPRETAKVAADAIVLVRVALCAMQCINIKQVEHTPAPKLQKARARRGKLPFFSYWTLEIGGDKSAAKCAGGGTHASPRWHMRRGHPRRLPAGGYTWVRACAVGSRKNGMIHKDYELRIGT